MNSSSLNESRKPGHEDPDPSGTTSNPVGARDQQQNERARSEDGEEEEEERGGAGDFLGSYRSQEEYVGEEASSALHDEGCEKGSSEETETCLSPFSNGPVFPARYNRGGGGLDEMAGRGVGSDLGLGSSRGVVSEHGGSSGSSRGVGLDQGGGLGSIRGVGSDHGLGSIRGVGSEHGGSSGSIRGVGSDQGGGLGSSRGVGSDLSLGSSRVVGSEHQSGESLGSGRGLGSEHQSGGSLGSSRGMGSDHQFGASLGSSCATKSSLSTEHAQKLESSRGVGSDHHSGGSLSRGVGSDHHSGGSLGSSSVTKSSLTTDNTHKSESSRDFGSDHHNVDVGGTLGLSRATKKSECGRDLISQSVDESSGAIKRLESGIDLSSDPAVDGVNLETSSASKKAILSYVDAPETEKVGKKPGFVKRLSAGSCQKSTDIASSPNDNILTDSSSLEAFMKNPLSNLSGEIEAESLAPLNASFFSCQYQTPSWIDDPLLGVPPSAMENKNTHRKTGADMRILTAYMRSLNEMRLPEAIPPNDLDKYLSSFFLVVRKADGSEYEPCSLRAMLASIERYLRFKNYPLSLTRDSAFSNMRNVLKLKQQTLRSIGKGQKTPSDVSPSSLARDGKIAHLFKSQEMGPYTPSSVVFTLCFYFCMYLRLRKSTENKKLLWGDITLCKDDSGREFLTFSSQMLRRAQGSSKMNARQRSYRVWADPSSPEKDPVTIYKFYAQKRPTSMNTNFAPFYLGINVLYPSQGQLWYRPAAMGINKLNEMVRQIRDITGVHHTSDFYSGVQVTEKQVLEQDSKNQDDRSSPRDFEDRRGFHVDVKLEVMDDSEDDDCNSNLAIDFSQDQQDPPLDCSQSNMVPGLSSHFTAASGSTALAAYSDRDNSSDSFSQQSFPANTNGDVAHELRNGDHGQEMDLTKGSNPDSPLNCSTKGRASYDSSDNIVCSLSSGMRSSSAVSISEAKQQLMDIVQKMGLSDIEKFNQWLKSVSFSADPLSGHIVCKEDEEDDDGGDVQSREPMSVRASSISGALGASITLNISLTPQALQGEGPITVTAQTSVSPDQQRSLSSNILNHHSKPSSQHGRNSSATSKTPSSFLLGSKPRQLILTPPGQTSPDKPLDLATSPVSRSTKLTSSSASLSTQSSKSSWLSGNNGTYPTLATSNCGSHTNLDSSPLAKRLRLSAEQAEAYTSASIMASLSSANFVSERLRLQLMQAGLQLGDYRLDTHTANLMDLTSSELLRSQLLQHYGIKPEPK